MAFFLPFLDTRHTVDSRLAYSADDGLFGLRHDQLLTNDAENVGEKATLVQFCLIDEPVLHVHVIIAFSCIKSRVHEGRQARLNEEFFAFIFGYHARVISCVFLVG